MQSDNKISAAEALQIVKKYEETNGWHSSEKPKPGYDLVLRNDASHIRYIEVKGIGGRLRDITFSRNASKLGKNRVNFYVYIVNRFQGKHTIYVIPPDVVWSKRESYSQFLIKTKHFSGKEVKKVEL